MSTVLKFGGQYHDDLQVLSVGGTNKSAVAMAAMMMQEMGGFAVQTAQESALQAVAGISGKGIQIG